MQDNQLDLEFKGSPVYDSRFKQGTVYLSIFGENDMKVISGIWTISDEQAFTKAAKLAKITKRYDPERSFFVRKT